MAAHTTPTVAHSTPDVSARPMVSTTAPESYEELDFSALQSHRSAQPDSITPSSTSPAESEDSPKAPLLNTFDEWLREPTADIQYPEVMAEGIDIISPIHRHQSGSDDLSFTESLSTKETAVFSTLQKSRRVHFKLSFSALGGPSFTTEALRNLRPNHHLTYGPINMLQSGLRRFLDSKLMQFVSAGLVQSCLFAVAQTLHSKTTLCTCTDEDMWEHQEGTMEILEAVAAMYPALPSQSAEQRFAVQSARARHIFELLRGSLDNIGEQLDFERFNSVPACRRALECILHSVAQCGEDYGDLLGTWAADQVLTPASRTVNRASTFATNYARLAAVLDENNRSTYALSARPRLVAALDKISVDSIVPRAHSTSTTTTTGPGQPSALGTAHSEGRRNSVKSKHHSSTDESAVQSPVPITIDSDHETAATPMTKRRSSRPRPDKFVNYNQKKHVLDGYLSTLSPVEASPRSNKRPRMEQRDASESVDLS